MQSALDALHKKAVSALVRRQTANKADGGGLMREVAEAFVAAREHFFTKDGDPDWLGRTYVYRQWVGEVFSDASIPSDQLNSVQGAVRWHIGSVLREKLSAEQLRELGLMKETPVEKGASYRARNAELIRLFGSDSPITDPHEIEVATSLISSTLSRIEGAAVGKLTQSARREVGGTLRAISTAADGLAGEALSRKQ